MSEQTRRHFLARLGQLALLTSIPTIPLLSGCTPTIPDYNKNHLKKQGETLVEIKTKQGETVSLCYDHYKQKGETIALAHGLIGSKYLGNLPKLLLQQGFSLLAWDQKGCGYSQATPSGYTLEDSVYETEQLFNALDIDSAHLVGFSKGATLAWKFKQTHPERVKKTIYISGYIPKITTPKILELRQTLTSDLVRDIMNHDLFKKQFKKLFYNQQLPIIEDIAYKKYLYLKNIDRWFVNCTICGAAEEILGITSKGFAQTLDKNDLFVNPSHDTLLTLVDRAEQEFARLYPNTNSLQIINKSGHFIYLERPRKLIRTIQPHLQ